MKTITFCLILLFAVLASSGQAQEHPFLSHFGLTEVSGGVRLDWTMNSGSTCFGIQILRSFDGLNFEQIGAISGECGSVSEPVDYEFLDERPEAFRTHYYRLELGVNGPSSIQTILVDQVIQGESIVLYPDGERHVIVYTRIPLNEDALLTVHDIRGQRLVSTRVKDGYRIRLDNGLRPGGIYIFRVEHEGRVISGKFLGAG